MKRKVYSAVLCLVVLAAWSAYAIVEGKDADSPWSWGVSGSLDAEVLAKLPKESFLLNLGPTGIRGRMTTDPPYQWCVEGTKEILVRYVFNPSPAAGKINVGDTIVGANGKLFTKGPHVRKNDECINSIPGLGRSDGGNRLGY